MALSAFYAGSKMVNVVIETPRESPFKLKYEETHNVFRVHKSIPLGLVFPFDFGFIPSTHAPDGDPIDALVLSAYPMPVGCVVLAEIVDALTGRQTENGKTERNDRIIVAPVDSVSLTRMQPEIVLNNTLRKEIGDFFVKYNDLQGKQFETIAFAGAEEGVHLTRRAMEGTRYQRAK